MSTLDAPVLGERLATWLRTKLGAPDLRVISLGTPGESGFSTETLFLDVVYSDQGLPSTRSLVVRFENQGPGLFLGASFSLQWNVISAMAKHPLPPTPTPIGLEPDSSVLGAAFSVVERVPGRVAPQIPNYNNAGWICDLTAAHRNLQWRNAIAAIAQIHRIDWRDGFEFLDQPQRGKPGLEQLLDWMQEWYDWTRGRDRHPLVESALEKLRREQPTAAPVNVLWGDASPNNILFRDDLTVAAVLDWEAAALGPGEIDLAWWLAFDTYLSSEFGFTRLAGLPDRDETIATYEAAVGRPVDHMRYYDLLAQTRHAILSMRSVKRQVALGRIRPETNAIIHNPPARMLARLLGIESWDVGEDYRQYLQAVLQAHKRGSA